MYLVVPDWVIYSLLVAAWLGVLYLYVIKPFLIPRIDNYFANRRAIRRMRKYTMHDAEFSQKIFDVNSIYPNNIYTPTSRKVNQRVTARHRR